MKKKVVQPRSPQLEVTYDSIASAPAPKKQFLPKQPLMVKPKLSPWLLLGLGLAGLAVLVGLVSLIVKARPLVSSVNPGEAVALDVLRARDLFSNSFAPAQDFSRLVFALDHSFYGVDEQAPKLEVEGQLFFLSQTFASLADLKLAAGDFFTSEYIDQTMLPLLTEVNLPSLLEVNGRLYLSQLPPALANPFLFTPDIESMIVNNLTDTSFSLQFGNHPQPFRLEKQGDTWKFAAFGIESSGAGF
jgi:hypothetical protein